MTDHTIIFADALDGLRSLEPESIDCCFTSPPYWGLRSYSDDPRELGKEATPEEYVSRLVAIFAEVRRVLKPGGTVALNLGDSYTGNASPGGEESRTCDSKPNARDPIVMTKRGHGLKPKDLVMIPARVALALQADGAADPKAMRIIARIRDALIADFASEDEWPPTVAREVRRLDEEFAAAHEGGWWLRSDMIWAKGLSGEATRDPDAWCGSVMPESVTDRPTQAHEHIFLLSKEPRYWYDDHAVREEGKYPAGTRAAKGGQQRAATEGVNARPAEYAEYSGTRNLRNVLTVSPRGFSGAHFAVFPVELPLMLLPAICPPQVCAECGVAYEHRVEKSVDEGTRGEQPWSAGSTTGRPQRDSRGGLPQSEARDLGYHPACACDAPAIPGTVLDPFGGSATVAQAARKLGRRSVSIELNPAYEAVMRERLDLPAEGSLFGDEDLGVEFVTQEVGV